MHCQLQLGSDKTYLTYFGSEITKKGEASIGYLVEATRILGLKIPNLAMVFIGWVD